MWELYDVLSDGSFSLSLALFSEIKPRIQVKRSGRRAVPLPEDYVPWTGILPKHEDLVSSRDSFAFAPRIPEIFKRFGKSPRKNL
jgi:hypothetical protein